MEYAANAVELVVEEGLAEEGLADGALTDDDAACADLDRGAFIVLERVGLGQPVRFGGACVRRGPDDCSLLEVDGEAAVPLGLVEEGLEGAHVRRVQLTPCAGFAPRPH